MPKLRVLFLCTGNSCRSQMAEAIVNAQMGERWQASSAGTRPAGYIHPNALQALAEIGIQHEGSSKSIVAFRTARFDLIVTVCDAAADECPAWLGAGEKAHRSFPDPAKATGSQAEIMQQFRQVRDAIGEQIPRLLDAFELRGNPEK